MLNIASVQRNGENQVASELVNKLQRLIKSKKNRVAQVIALQRQMSEFANMLYLHYPEEFRLSLVKKDYPLVTRDERAQTEMNEFIKNRPGGQP